MEAESRQRPVLRSDRHSPSLGRLQPQHQDRNAALACGQPLSQGDGKLDLAAADNGVADRGSGNEVTYQVSRRPSEPGLPGRICMVTCAVHQLPYLIRRL
jgi:hypothetical protein